MKAPPTGRDGIMRTRAGGGAGFEVSHMLFLLFPFGIDTATAGR